MGEHTTTRRVDYFAKEYKEGRVYGQGYQSVPGWIRRICAHKYYMDIDMVNAGPRAFIQVLRKENLKVPGSLKKYAYDRESMYPLVKEFMPDATEKEIKGLLLQAFHCGGQLIGAAPTVIDILRQQVTQVARTLSMLPGYADLYAIKNAGFLVVVKNYCKTCKEVASKDGCGAHYNKANRSKKTVFVNMFIQKTVDSFNM